MADKPVTYTQKVVTAAHAVSFTGVSVRDASGAVTALPVTLHYAPKDSAGNVIKHASVTVTYTSFNDFLTNAATLLAAANAAEGT